MDVQRFQVFLMKLRQNYEIPMNWPEKTFANSGVTCKVHQSGYQNDFQIKQDQKFVDGQS